VIAAWRASAHNAVLLNPSYNAVGIGLVYAPSSTHRWYWAADFGGPGWTVKIVVLPAAQRSAQETLDPEGVAQAPPIVFIDDLVARRMAHLIAVLQRMGVI
jgi:hypothetical protein